MKAKLWLIIVYFITIFLATTNYALATDSSATWLPTFSTGIVSGTKEISVPSSLTIKTYSLQGEELGWWIQNLNTVPVVTNKVIIECNVALVGLPNFQEIGLTYDWKTFFKAEWVEGVGYVVRVDTSKLPTGVKSLNWYIKHNNNYSILSFFGVQIKNAIEGKGYGISFIAVTKAPELWDEMEPARKLRYLHGFYPIESWCENPQEMEQWITDKKSYGDILVNATPGSIIECDVGDGQIRQQTVQPGTDGFAIQHLPIGTCVRARYINQKTWTGEAIVVAGKTNLQWRYGLLRIISSNPTSVDIETNYQGQVQNGGGDLLKSRILSGYSLTFLEIPDGLTVKIKRAGAEMWLGPFTVIGGQSRIVDMDKEPLLQSNSVTP